MTLIDSIWRMPSALLTKLGLIAPRAGPDNPWILNEIDTLYRSCRFEPENAPFLLDPELFDSVGDYRAQIAFLAKRHDLDSIDIEVYMHGDLKQGRKKSAGLAQYPYSFDTSSLGANEKLLSVNEDGSYSVMDTTDSKRPKIRHVRGPIALSPTPAAIFVDQAYINRKAERGRIIAHEIAHLYLYDRGIHKPILPSIGLTKEYQTDIAMFVMGLGLIALRASSAYRRLGYLSYRQMTVVHKRVLELQSRPG